jgi:hypothetical protein
VIGAARTVTAELKDSGATPVSVGAQSISGADYLIAGGIIKTA